MRIVFIGCVKSSELFLRKLIAIKADLAGVVTKAESKFNADFSDLGKICREQQIDYLQIRHINDEDAKVYIKNKAPDLILCLGWSQLLDEETLRIPKLGCIGFHPAELPFNRGRHPLIWALALGLRRTASTLFLMDAAADTGKIVSQQYIDIDDTDDAASLYDKIMEKAVIQLENVLEDFENGSVTFIEPKDKGNVWRKRGREDGKIDWRMSGRSIYNLVRALTKPYVGAHFLYQDKEYKVWKVEEVNREGYENIEPGKVVAVVSDHEFTVKAGDHLVNVLDCEQIHLTIGEYL
jgi:methionyl-tRNA formyltransferase